LEVSASLQGCVWVCANLCVRIIRIRRETSLYQAPLCLSQQGELMQAQQAVGSGQRAAGSGQWAAGSGQRAAGSGPRAMAVETRIVFSVATEVTGANAAEGGAETGAAMVTEGSGWGWRRVGDGDAGGAWRTAEKEVAVMVTVEGGAEAATVEVGWRWRRRQRGRR
jgi:hypothetical protein